jgi:hypothetical protein
MLPIPLPGAEIAYACGCGVLLGIDVPSTDHIGFGEVYYKSMQLDGDWEFFRFLNHLSRIGSCPLARSILASFYALFVAWWLVEVGGG